MDINFRAVIAAATSSFVLGGIWYSPLLFLKPWTAAMGRSEDQSQAHSAKTFALAFAFAMLSAILFAGLLGPAPEFLDAVRTGLLVGFGFVAASFGINYQFADRPLSAWFVDGGFHSAQFVLYGVVLGLWH